MREQKKNPGQDIIRSEDLKKRTGLVVQDGISSSSSTGRKSRCRSCGSYVRVVRIRLPSINAKVPRFIRTHVSMNVKVVSCNV